ncbi:MAG: hypothetical protein R2706_13620 [Acidimicrobiales bacterium]
MSEATRQNQRALEQLAAAEKHRAAAEQAAHAAADREADINRLTGVRSTLEAERAATAERRSILAVVRADEPTRRAAFVAATDRLARRRSLADLVDELKQTEDRLEALVQQHERLATTAEQVAAEIGTAEAIAATLLERTAAADELVTAVNLRRELSAAQQKHEVSTAAFEQARTASEAVVREFARAASWRLAEALVPDQPCSVCGSTEHPAPAVDPAGGGSADLGAVEAAHRSLADAGEAMYAAQNDVTRLTTALGPRAAMPRADLETAKSEALQRVAEATAAAELVKEAAAKQVAITAEIAANHERRSTVTAERPSTGRPDPAGGRARIRHARRHRQAC